MKLLTKMEYSNNNYIEEETQPVSPTGQYFNSSVLSVAVLGVLESQVPLDDSLALPLVKDVFLPINPRFSSIMVKDKEGEKHWKKVEVRIKDHIIIPIFPEKLSKEFYDNCLSDYLSKISTEQFQQSRPLWEIHIFKYPTSNAEGNVVFKLHHALGDGYSLMGALLSCLQRADNPSLALTFPTFQKKQKVMENNNYGMNIFSGAISILSGMVNTMSDFGWSLLKSSFLEDDRTPVRSGEDGVEFKPITINTMVFSLHQIKQIKDNLQVTINDVICGVIFLGTRLYMQRANNNNNNTNNEHYGNANSTALVLLNTRDIGGYKTINEMVGANVKSPWGNQFGFLHVSVPKLTLEGDTLNPLKFISKTKEVIKRKRNSSAVYLTGRLLETLREHTGPEVTAKYIHSTLKNSSMTVSNIMGPIEQMSLANHPVKGLYFMVVGVPQSLTITMVSYMTELRVAVGTEKGLIDPQIFKSCIHNAFDMIFEAAVKSPSQD